MTHRLIRTALAALALSASVARADDGGPPTLSFSGFGTLGAAHSSERQADFTSTSLKPDGAGYSRRWSADVDSRLGAQMIADITGQVSVVVQLVSEQGPDNSYRPTVEWANVKFQVTPDFSVRVGRIQLPAYMVSDSRKVGYANAWIRPPVEVYDLEPISSSDGLDLQYRVNIGQVSATVQALYGRSDPRLPVGSGNAKARDARGVAVNGERGAATVHVAYLKANVTLDALDPLFAGFRQFGPQGVALADQYGTTNKPFTFLTVGGAFDPGDWFVQAEWGRADNHSAFLRKSAWYVTGGIRRGALTPHATYAHAKADSATSDPGLTLSTLPPSLAGPASALNAGLNAVLAMAPVQNTVSLGMRWDFAKNVAAKIQYDHLRIGAGSPGTLINPQPAFQTGGSVNVFSAAIDFLF